MVTVRLVKVCFPVGGTPPNHSAAILTTKHDRLPHVGEELHSSGSFDVRICLADPRGSSAAHDRLAALGEDVSSRGAISVHLTQSTD
jgi:hypothetical protein